MSFHPFQGEVYIGGIGFAQVGQDDYRDKMIIERDVVLDHMNAKHPVPKEFQPYARYKWTANPHDFGTYHDLNIIFDECAIDNMEDEDEEMHQRFWDWANAAESEAGWMEDNLMEECEKRYRAEHQMQIVHKGRTSGDDLTIAN